MWLFYYNNICIVIVYILIKCLVIEILFVRGCIIEADKTDYQDDILSKADIKRINLNLDNVKFDINHSKEPIEGCKLVENSITDYPLSIDDVMVNPGSWIVTISVDNSELEKQILDGMVAGFSLFSYSNDATTYDEVLNKDDIYPIFISFVPNPSNQLHFEVLSEMKYICKSESDIMADNENNFIEKLKEMISSYDTGSSKTNEENGTKPTDTNKESGAVSKAGGTPPAEKDKQDNMQTDKNTDEVSKACGDKEEESAVKKDDGTALPGQKMETQGSDGISILNAKMDKLINILSNPNPQKEDTNENVGEANKNYIVKSETVKNDKPLRKETEKVPHFDLFGRKL